MFVDSATEAYATALISIGKVSSLSEVDLDSNHAKKFMPPGDMFPPLTIKIIRKRF